SVFLPASFLPGITGQMFRQFALVIAATAVISALNALTLNPVQCALYLRPIPPDHRVNWFFRGFNRAYTAVEGAYVAPVSRMVRRPGLTATVFIAIVALAVVAFARRPTAFLPSEDQGYCIVEGRLPPGASQPRVRELAAGIDAILAKTPGIKGWVTSGGFSALDSAILSNAVTEYVMYEDWAKRPAGLSQPKMVARPRSRPGP